MDDDRTVLKITGTERLEFLQGLVTNDVHRMDTGLVYAALLSPQGKYLADFFLVPLDGDTIGLDVKADLVPALIKRLSMYKLRAAVAIEATDLTVARGLCPAPDGAFADPRHDALGWRSYGTRQGEAVDWDAIRVAHAIPESGIELIPEESFILEMGFGRLSGVDFRKGCYVGQEVTARMKHKTELRKGLARVAMQGAAPVGSTITAEGKPVGTLFTQADGHALAYLRFDRARGDMTAQEAHLSLAGE